MRWDGKPVPSLDWFVPGLFLRGTVGILSGEPAGGKTLILQQLMTCAALGTPWLGFTPQRSRSFALFCEDNDTVLHRNQHFINKAYGCQMGDIIEDIEIKPGEGQDNELFSFDRFTGEISPKTLWDQCCARIDDIGASVFLIDTVTEAFGGNQNNPIHVRRFLSYLRRQAIRMQGLILLTQHPSRTGTSEGHGKSGSEAWNGSVRSRAYLTRPKGAGRNQRELRIEKLNQGPGGDVIKLTWQNGIFVRDEPPALPIEDQWWNP